VRVRVRDLETSTMRRPFGLLRHRKYVSYLAIVCRPIVPMERCYSFPAVVALFSQLCHLKDKDVTLLVTVCSAAVCVLDLHCFFPCHRRCFPLGGLGVELVLPVGLQKKKHKINWS